MLVIAAQIHQRIRAVDEGLSVDVVIIDLQV